MVPNAQPSIDPANNDTLLGTFREILKKHLQAVDDMLPARVVAFDRATNRVQVQLLVMIKTTNGQNVSRNQLASIPVLQIGGGNFVLNFPLNPGDLGWVKASDRDISLFTQSYTESPPNTLRLHSFQDALFIPDVMRGWVINDEDAGNVVLQTLDGACRVAIWPDRVKVTAPQVVLDTPLVYATGNVQVQGDLNVVGDTNGTGSLQIDGNINTLSSVTAAVQVTANGINLSTHTHSGVQTGGSNTGGPNP